MSTINAKIKHFDSICFAIAILILCNIQLVDLINRLYILTYANRQYIFGVMIGFSRAVGEVSLRKSKWWFETCIVFHSLFK